MIRILLVACPTLIRDSIMKILSAEKDIKVNGAVGTVEEAMVYVAREDYDVILVKNFIPEIDGFAVLEQILELKPELKVILFGVTTNKFTALHAYQAGAVGYISMDEMVSELITAARRVHGGAIYISSKISEKIVSELTRKTPRSTKILSPREYEVFMRIVNGKTMTEIIKEMRVAPSTATTLRKRVLMKTEAKNNCELIKYAIREKIINL